MLKNISSSQIQTKVSKLVYRFVIARPVTFRKETTDNYHPPETLVNDLSSITKIGEEHTSPDK